MDVQQKVYTAEDLWRLSHRAGEHKRYELLRGELIEMSPTGETLGILTAWLSYLILGYVDSNSLGEVLGAETGFRLSDDPDTVFAPDIAFISESRRQSTTEKYLDIAPDLVAEVVSPGNDATEINEKIAAYFAAGTRLVWIVYPKTKTVYVYSSAENVQIVTASGTLTGADVLPGFSVSVQEVFKKIKD